VTVRTSMTGLNELRAVLEDARRDVVPEAKKVLSKAALNIKTDARAKITGVRHAPMYPYTINYDTSWKGTLGRAEIGPDPTVQVGGGPHRTPGNLGAILEYGTPRTQAQPHLGPALDYEGPNLVKYLGELGEDLLT
jgi:hypothetical protein